jgi:hypothetical protein
MHCRQFVPGSKSIHEQACDLKKLAKIPRKRKSIGDD